MRRADLQNPRTNDSSTEHTDRHVAGEPFGQSVSPRRGRLVLRELVEVALEVDDPTQDVQRDVISHGRVDQPDDGYGRKRGEIDVIEARSGVQHATKIRVPVQGFGRVTPLDDVVDVVEIATAVAGIADLHVG